MSKLLLEDLSYRLRGCFYEIYNELGPGHKEQIYHVYYYLRGSDCVVGYLVNFGSDKIDIRRRVYDVARSIRDNPC